MVHGQPPDGPDGVFVNRHCPFCGGMVAPKIEYCTHCGYDLPPEQADEAVRDVVEGASAVKDEISGSRSCARR
jgi:hypothetical protein